MSYFVTFKDIPQILSYNGSVVMPVLFLFVFLFIVFLVSTKRTLIIKFIICYVVVLWHCCFHQF